MENALDFIIMMLLAVGAFLLRQLKVATDATVKTTAEETAREIVKEFVWPQELARELQRTRGMERQELRYRSYAALWKELRPLAIYDARAISRRDVGKLSENLSNWYFSQDGGLLLTPQTRDFYFALQDLLRVAATSAVSWTASRSDAHEWDLKEVFGQLLRNDSGAAPVLEYFKAEKFTDWNARAARLGGDWRRGINQLGRGWDQLSEEQRFAALQQVGSILRTSLTNDLESRLQ